MDGANTSQNNRRGQIINRERASQLRDFEGLRWGTITPTDLDMGIDYHNDGFIYGETKFTGTKIPHGQRLFLQRQVMNCKKPAVAFITEHNHSPNEMIDMANTVVREYYTNFSFGTVRTYAWIKLNNTLRLREASDIFIKEIEKGKNGNAR